MPQDKLEIVSLSLGLEGIRQQGGKASTQTPDARFPLMAMLTFSTQKFEWRPGACLEIGVREADFTLRLEGVDMPQKDCAYVRAAPSGTKTAVEETTEAVQSHGWGFGLQGGIGASVAAGHAQGAAHTGHGGRTRSVEKIKGEIEHWTVRFHYTNRGEVDEDEGLRVVWRISAPGAPSGKVAIPHLEGNVLASPDNPEDWRNQLGMVTVKNAVWTIQPVIDWMGCAEVVIDKDAFSFIDRRRLQSATKAQEKKVQERQRARKNRTFSALAMLVLKKEAFARPAWKAVTSDKPEGSW